MHVTSAGLCACGKGRYVSRKAARHAGKANHPGEHLSSYRCGPYWHYGHLKRRVLTGAMTRDGQTNGAVSRLPATVLAQMRSIWEATRSTSST
jgi:hypothetical protein